MADITEISNGGDTFVPIQLCDLQDPFYKKYKFKIKPRIAVLIESVGPILMALFNEGIFYILEKHFLILMGGNTNDNRETVKMLLEKKILGKGFYRGVRYFYPLRLAMKWYENNPNAKGKEEPNNDDNILLCSFIRVECLCVTGDLAIINSTKYIDDYLLCMADREEYVCLVENDIIEHKKKEPPKHANVSSFINLIKQILLPDEEINIKLTLQCFLTPKKVLKQIQRIIRDYVKQVIEQFKCVQTQIENAAVQYYIWQKENEELMYQRNFFRQKINSFPVTINGWIFQLSKKYKTQIVLDAPMSEKLIILKEKIQRLPLSNCYLYHTEMDSQLKKITLYITIIGSVFFPETKYRNILNTIFDIARTQGESQIVNISIASPSNRAEQTIKTHVEKADSLFQKDIKRKFPHENVKFNFTNEVYDIEQHFKTELTEKDLGKLN